MKLSPKAAGRRAELRRIMERRELSPRDVSKLVYKSPQAVRSWLRGERNMPESALRLLTFTAGE